MDRQRVLRRSFVKTTISSRLKCPICFEVFYKPRRLYCGHTFCKPCLQELFKPHKNPQHINRCPLCRKTIQTKKIGYDFIATKIIDELQVSCPVKGCPWKGENAVLQTHYSFQCKMKDYYNHGSKIRRKVVFQDESYDKEDDVMEKINENIQKGALISRVVSKNPHLLKNIRKEQHELMRQKDGIPRLIDSVTQTRRLKSNHSAREVFKPRRSQLLEEFDYDEAVVIFTPPNAMMKKIASLKKVKNESIIKPKVKKTYADDLNQIERLQKEMGLVADNSDHYLEQQFLSKKVKPLIINLQTKT